MKFITKTLTILGLLAISAQAALADNPLDATNMPPPNSPATIGAYQLWGKVIHIMGILNNLLLEVSGGIAVVMLVVGGIYYIMGQADTGKKILTTTIIGIIIISAYWSIMHFAIGIIFDPAVQPFQ